MAGIWEVGRSLPPRGIRSIGSVATAPRRWVGSAQFRKDRDGNMAWDFETEPEFQKKLDWIDEFLDTEVDPISQLGVGYAGVKSRTYQKAVRPLQAKVKAQGLWACHLGPELGGGLRPGETRAHERAAGPRGARACRVRLPGARHRQRGDHRALRDRAAEEGLSLAAAQQRDHVRLFDDGAARRFRSAGVPDECGARRQ